MTADMTAGAMTAEVSARSRAEATISRREAILSAVGLFALALVIRWYAASLVAFPKPEDTAYYVDVARNLLAGRGLVSDALWSFQTAPLEVPRAAFEVWLPLPTFLAAIPMAIAGATFAAAQVSSVIVGSIVPVLAWRLAADVAAARGLPSGRARTLAIGAGVTAAVSLPLLLHSTLPDSTMPFAVLTLTACLLMNRIAGPAASAGGAASTETRWVIALGVVLGLAALTRNEALIVGLAWAIVAWRLPRPRSDRLRLIALPAGIAVLVFAPWLVRDWLAFGTPLPGQALANALSLQGTDIFAWQDPPTLSRYLAAGLPELLRLRVVGVSHNLFDVLLLPGAPLSFIGLVGLPWVLQDRPLQPLLVVSGLIFLVTGLVFPVSTTWGTFLHAAGAIHVLLIVSALLALDALIAWIGRQRAWHRPVAWLAPTLTVSGAILFSTVLLPSFGADSSATSRVFVAVDEQLDAAGVPPDPAHPVITDAPIWLPYTRGGTALALPRESPGSVLDLAHRFGATAVLTTDGSNPFEAALAGGGMAAGCFEPVSLIGTPILSAEDPNNLRLWRIVCP